MIKNISNGLRFYPEKTKIIFFDLEYYVPLNCRERKSVSGMKFSPVLPGHKIIGGSFQIYYPMQDSLGKKINIWEWSLGSEEKVLKEIFQLFEREWRSIEAKNNAGSLMLAGIGISHSDIPTLLSRLSSESIASQERIYDLLCGCRQIDLTTATFSQFNFNQGYFAYPKTKSALYQKYLSGKKIESGKSVWDMYDNKFYKSIENRCSEEVDDCLEIYKSMVDLKKKNDRAISRLKKFEKSLEEKESTII